MIFVFKKIKDRYFNVIKINNVICLKKIKNIYMQKIKNEKDKKFDAKTDFPILFKNMYFLQ